MDYVAKAENGAYIIGNFKTGIIVFDTNASELESDLVLYGITDYKEITIADALELEKNFSSKESIDHIVNELGLK